MVGLWTQMGCVFRRASPSLRPVPARGAGRDVCVRFGVRLLAVWFLLAFCAVRPFSVRFASLTASLTACSSVLDFGWHRWRCAVACVATVSQAGVLSSPLPLPGQGGQVLSLLRLRRLCGLRDCVCKIHHHSASFFFVSRPSSTARASRRLDAASSGRAGRRGHQLTSRMSGVRGVAALGSRWVKAACACSAAA